MIFYEWADFSLLGACFHGRVAQRQAHFKGGHACDVQASLVYYWNVIGRRHDRLATAPFAVTSPLFGYPR